MPSWNRISAKPACRSGGESCKFRDYNWGNFFSDLRARATLPTLMSGSEMVCSPGSPSPLGQNLLPNPMSGQKHVVLVYGVPAEVLGWGSAAGRLSFLAWRPFAERKGR